MSMDFINILKDIIQEQRPQGGARPPRVAGGAVAGVTQGAQAGSQSGNSSREVPLYSWQSGDKIGPALKNPRKCANYHEWRQRYNDGRGGYHNACDVGTNKKLGVPVIAPYDGKVIWINNNACGDGIDLTGEVDGKKLYSRFCHLRDRSTKVPSGTEVTKGTFIATTGGAKDEPGAGTSTGAHLHWSFTVDGVHKNPYTYN